MKAAIPARRLCVLLIGRNKVDALIAANFQDKPFDVIGWDVYDASEKLDPAPDFDVLRGIVSRAARVDAVAIGGGLAASNREAVASLCQELCPSAKVSLRPMEPGEREEFMEIMKRGDAAEIAAAKAAGKGPSGIIMFVNELVESLGSA